MNPGNQSSHNQDTDHLNLKDQTLKRSIILKNIT